MKYNKIAMLVAGGLLVCASGTGFAVDLGTLSADVPEFGTLVGIDTSAKTLSATLTGSNTLADLNEAPFLDTSFCFQGNTSGLALDPGSFDMASPYAIDSDDTAGGRVITNEIGGANIVVTAWKLKLDGYTTSPYTDSDKVIDYSMQLTSTATTGTEEHVDTAGVYGTSCGSVPYRLIMEITDSDKFQHAGNYSTASANTVTLSAISDE